MQRAGLALVCALAVAACTRPSLRPEILADRELRSRTLDQVEARLVAERVRGARELLQLRQFPAAAAMAEQALDLDPRSAQARAVLGMALVQRALEVEPPDLRLQNLGDGETLTAVRLSPLDPYVCRLRGCVLAALHHLTAAAAIGESCLDQIAPSNDGDYIDLLTAVAEWCYELGEERRAIPRLWTLTRLRPDDVTAHFRLGSSLLRTAGDVAGATDAAIVMERCAELSPGDDDVHLAVVAAHARVAELTRDTSGEGADAAALARAAATCERVIARFPELAEARFRSGVIAERRAMPLEAQRAYEATLARDPGHLGALLNLAAMFAAPEASEGDRQRARAFWQRASDVDRQGGGLTAEERRRVMALLQSP